MKIVIADGGQSADYIVKQFNKRGNKLIVISSDKAAARYITKTNKLPVFHGDPSKYEILDNANIHECDLFIALGKIDADNYVSCLLAKKVFGAKKCICTVSNPKNVDLYRSLGIDSVISSTYLLASSIVSESSLEKLTKSMSFENDKIVLTEIVVKESSALANKMIMEFSFPKTGTISCVYRKPTVIIPNGKTLIMPGDILFVVSAVKDQQELIDFVQRDKYNSWKEKKQEDIA